MISNHPENGDTALVIGRGGALRSARCLTVRGVAGLPGGGKAAAEAWIVSWLVQVKGKVGTCWLSWGSFSFRSTELPRKGLKQGDGTVYAPSQLRVAWLPVPIPCAVCPPAVWFSLTISFPSPVRVFTKPFQNDRTSPLAYWDPRPSLYRGN